MSSLIPFQHQPISHLRVRCFLGEAVCTSIARLLCSKPQQQTWLSFRDGGYRNPEVEAKQRVRSTSASYAPTDSHVSRLRQGLQHSSSRTNCTATGPARGHRLRGRKAASPRLSRVVHGSQSRMIHRKKRTNPASVASTESSRDS
jgi:hypothetical protein